MEKVLALVISGGVAPGPSVVTQTVFNEASQYGFKKILFIRDAFLRLQEGKKEEALLSFSKEEVAGFHLLGGSVQGNSKPGSPKTDTEFKEIIKSLEELGVTDILAVGGDDSAKSLCKLAKLSTKLSIVLIPKTMDDDVSLPESFHTLGVSTTVEQAAKDFSALQANARQLERQYMLVSMGRNSGRTPYFIGRKAAADLILVREFFREPVSLLDLAKIILGSRLLKELENPFPKPFSHGVLIAENMIEFMKEGEIKELDQERKKYSEGNIDLSEIPFADHLEKAVANLFTKLGKKRVVACETMGAAPRGYPANQVDLELARGLTRHGLSLLKDIGSKEQLAKVVFCAESCQSYNLSSLWDERSGKSKTRLVSEEMKVEARGQLLYLREADFRGEKLAKLAGLTNLDEKAFIEFFKESQSNFL